MALTRNTSSIDTVLHAAPVSAGHSELPLSCDLCSEIGQAFRTTGKAALRRIEIRMDAGHVTLQGRVASFYLKQLAQHVAASVTGVASVRNQLIVSEGDR